MELLEVTDAARWDAFVDQHQYGHPLQLWGWGEVKSEGRWTPLRLALVEGEQWLAVALVLKYQIPRIGRTLLYVPRGPVAAPGSREAGAILQRLQDFARSQRAVYLRIEPAWPSGAPHGWVRSRHSVQMSQTYTMDLTLSEEELLAPMSHKHRQYIRQSERRGIEVKRVADGNIRAMYEIYQETAARAGFGIHPREYYEGVMRDLGEHNELYYAYVEGRPVAFLWNAWSGRVAYELYGGMRDEASKLHANYSLKWHAFLAAKAAGKTVYDFNGRVSAGVSAFKAGFGPQETDWIGTYDYPVSRLSYRAWESLWPVAKGVVRVGARLSRG